MVKNMKIYALGSNGEGQLGTGNQDDTSVPTPCLLPDDLASLPTAVAAGGNHTLIHFADGSACAAGLNNDGRCGIPPRQDNLLRFEKVCFHDDNGPDGRIDRFRFVAATESASIFVTLDDRIYTCGTGNRGELGQGENSIESHLPTAIRVPGSSLTTPQLIPTGSSGSTKNSVVGLAAGMSHVVLVLSSGEVLGWGWGRKGQLGDPTVNQFSPRKIPGLKLHVREAVCGQEFTALLGNPRKVGGNADSTVDLRVHRQQPAAEYDQGEQQMRGVDFDKLSDPMPSEIRTIKQDIAGARHIQILGGRKRSVAADAPKYVRGLHRVVACWGSLVIVDDNGKLEGFGRNDFGQLGPDELAPVSAVVAGTEHILVQTDGDSQDATGNASEILACGWGEHGNTGHDGAVRSTTTANKIGVGFVLGAGWGTSWFYQVE